jgi:hypothetical protein
MTNGLVVTKGGMTISDTLIVATNLQVATSDVIVTAGSTSVIATGSNPAAFVSATHASYAGNLIQATLDASIGVAGNVLSLIEGNNNLLRVSDSLGVLFCGACQAIAAYMDCSVWYRGVPKFSTYGSVCCACAQRLGLLRACHSG